MNVVNYIQYVKFVEATETCRKTHLRVRPARRWRAKDARTGISAAGRLYSQRSVENVTIADVAHAAQVSPSTYFRDFKSRDGVLRALDGTVLFGLDYAAAIARLEGETDPVRLIALSASVARAIYDGGAASWAACVKLRPARRPFARSNGNSRPALRVAGRPRQATVRGREGASRTRRGTCAANSRMYTSRDSPMLVIDAGWTPAAYESWLADTLRRASGCSHRPKGHK